VDILVLPEKPQTKNREYDNENAQAESTAEIRDEAAERRKVFCSGKHEKDEGRQHTEEQPEPLYSKRVKQHKEKCKHQIKKTKKRENIKKDQGRKLLPVQQKIKHQQHNKRGKSKISQRGKKKNETRRKDKYKGSKNYYKVLKAKLFKDAKKKEQRKNTKHHGENLCYEKHINP